MFTTLYDSTGNPIMRPSLTPTAHQTRHVLGNMMIDQRNPDDVVAMKGAQYYRDMLKNPYVKAAIKTRVNAVVGRWEGATPHVPQNAWDREFSGQVLSNGANRGAERQAVELARKNLDEWMQDGWSGVLSRAMYGAITQGYSVGEIIWGFREFDAKPFGGKWCIRRVDDCVSDFFQFNRAGNIFMQESIWSYRATIPCPPYRFFIVTHDQQYANRYGESLLRSLVRIEWFERNAWAFWMGFLEKFGSPTIVGKVDPDANQQVRDALLRIMEMVKNQTGVVINEGESLDLLEATRQGEAGYQSLIELCHKLYAIVITGNALTLAPDQTGSYAMAANTTAPVREDILYADCEMLDRAVSYQILTYLTSLNFPRVEFIPYQRMLPPKIAQVSDAELLSRAQRDNMLWQMGLPMPIRYLLQTYRIPEAIEGEPILPRYETPGSTLPIRDGVFEQQQIEETLPDTTQRVQDRELLQSPPS